MQNREQTETRLDRKQSGLLGPRWDRQVWNRHGQRRGICLTNNTGDWKNGAQTLWQSSTGERCVMTGESHRCAGVLDWGGGQCVIKPEIIWRSPSNWLPQRQFQRSKKSKNPSDSPLMPLPSSWKELRCRLQPPPKPASSRCSLPPLPEEAILLWGERGAWSSAGPLVVRRSSWDSQTWPSGWLLGPLMGGVRETERFSGLCCWLPPPLVRTVGQKRHHTGGKDTGEAAGHSKLQPFQPRWTLEVSKQCQQKCQQFGTF